VQRQPCKEVGSVPIVRWVCCAGLQSKLIVRGQKLARAVPAAAHKCASEALSDYSE
jgi:hypothetical protein